MEKKNKEWVFLYWDEPVDVKTKDVDKTEDKDEKDDVH
jgi:hypothetical protein